MFKVVAHFPALGSPNAISDAISSYHWKPNGLEYLPHMLPVGTTVISSNAFNSSTVSHTHVVRLNVDKNNDLSAFSFLICRVMLIGTVRN